jgi:hypothetical protein
MIPALIPLLGDAARIAAITQQLLLRVDDLGKQTKDELRALREELRERLDRQDLTSLKSGALHLLDGDFEEARKSLVDAVSIEGRSPVARLLYAHALEATGRSERAETELLRAYLLNPFVAPSFTEALHDVVMRSVPNPDPAKWHRQLSGPHGIRWGTLRGKALQAYLADSQIRELALGFDPSSGDGTVVVEWERASRALPGFEVPPRTSQRSRWSSMTQPWREFDSQQPRAAGLQAVDLSGAARWIYRLEPGAKLDLVTPTFVVVRNSNEHFEFLDIKTGQQQGTPMRRDYFELVFCPFHATLDNSPAYEQMHGRLAGNLAVVSRMLTDPRIEPAKGFERRLVERRFIPQQTLLSESVELDPFPGSEKCRPRAINTYSFDRPVVAPPRPKPPKLRCKAIFGRDA